MIAVHVVIHVLVVLIEQGIGQGMGQEVSNKRSKKKSDKRSGRNEDGERWAGIRDRGPGQGIGIRQGGLGQFRADIGHDSRGSGRDRN